MSKGLAGNNAIPGTLNAPAGMGGVNAPISGSYDNAPEVMRAVNSASAGATGVPASDEAKATLNLSAVIVLGSLVLLWIFGGLVFKNANL